MANYYATTRSNYFRVKDATAFEAWCRRRQLEFWTQEVKGMGTCHAISGNETGWPYYDAEKDDEINLPAEIASHLNPNDAAILFEIGNEKLRYIVGRATAIHPDGTIVCINLDDIYEEAEEVFGPDVTITGAEY
jgi:hypothetical protein